MTYHELSEIRRRRLECCIAQLIIQLLIVHPVTAVCSNPSDAHIVHIDWSGVWEDKGELPQVRLLEFCLEVAIFWVENHDRGLCSLVSHIKIHLVRDIFVE